MAGFGGALAGLGGFGQGFSQGADAALRRQMLREQAKNALRESEANDAAFQAIKNGIPGLGGGPGGMLQPQYPPTAQPPMPGQASQPAQPPAPPPQVANGPPTDLRQNYSITDPSQVVPQLPATFQPHALESAQGQRGTFPPASPPIPGADMPGRKIFAPPTPQTQAGPGGEAPIAPPGSDKARQIPGPADAPITAQQLPPPVMPPAGDKPAAPAPPVPGIDPAHQVPASSGNQQFPDISQFFQSLDPQQIAQAVMKARPGIDGSTAMMAVEKIMGLSKYGQAEDKLRLAYMAHVLGFDVKVAMLGQGQQRIDLSKAHEAGVEHRAEISQGQRQEGFDLKRQQMQQQASQFGERMQAALAGRTSAQKLSALRALLTDVDKQLQPSLGTPPPSDEEAAQLQQQRTAIVNAMRQISQLPALPQGAAPPPSQ